MPQLLQAWWTRAPLASHPKVHLLPQSSSSLEDGTEVSTASRQLHPRIFVQELTFIPVTVILLTQPTTFVLSPRNTRLWDLGSNLGLALRSSHWGWDPGELHQPS